MNDILIESYQNLLEFQQEQFTTLSFELAKNEHEAIVSENMMLYKEAEEDFKTKLVNIAKTLYNKFMDFLTRAISTIMNLYVKISKKFLNKETMKKLENTVKEIKSIYRSEPNAKIAIDAIFKKSKITIHSLNGILNINDLKHLIKKLAVTLNKENLADSMDEIKKILDDLKKFGETDKGELIDSENAFNGSMVIKSYVVIDNMKNWIGVLKELRGTGTKQYKADLKNIQDGKISSEDRLNIAIIQRACSRTISSINYIAMSAIKILRSIDYISSKFNRVKSNNDDEIYNEPDEPNVDKSDRRKWKKGKTRIFRNNDYVNLANDEKEWLEYNRRTREHLKKENKKKEANDLKEKAHRLGYTHEDVDILDMFGEDNLFFNEGFLDGRIKDTDRYQNIWKQLLDVSDIIIDGLKKNDFDRKITCNTSKLKNKIDKLRSKKENKKNGFINDIILPIGLTMSATEADRLAGETKKILPNSFKFYVSKGSYFKDARYYWYDEKNYPDIVVLFNYIKETTYVNNIPTHTQYRLNFEVKYFSDRTKKSLNIGK